MHICISTSVVYQDPDKSERKERLMYGVRIPYVYTLSEPCLPEQKWRQPFASLLRQMQCCYATGYLGEMRTCTDSQRLSSDGMAWAGTPGNAPKGHCRQVLFSVKLHGDSDVVIRQFRYICRLRLDSSVRCV